MRGVADAAEATRVAAENVAWPRDHELFQQATGAQLKALEKNLTGTLEKPGKRKASDSDPPPPT
jgi:hypothetical protein